MNWIIATIWAGLSLYAVYCAIYETEDKKMNKLTYLYGFTKKEIEALRNMSYKEALEYKLKAAQQLAERLKESSTDSTRKWNVGNAIKANQLFLKELE